MKDLLITVFLFFSQQEAKQLDVLLQGSFTEIESTNSIELCASMCFFLAEEHLVD